MEWTRKDLLSLYDLSAEEITFLLDTAEEFKKVSERKVKKVPALRGKTVVNFFVEPSTRTRVSFELAEQRLSADIVNMQAQVSSLRKGETLLDTVRNIEALQVDLVVMRHSTPGAQDFIARHLKCGVVNAGDGAHSHPTQALLDIFTIREKRGRIAGRQVRILGDILHSHVGTPETRCERHARGAVDARPPRIRVGRREGVPQSQGGGPRRGRRESAADSA